MKKIETIKSKETFSIIIHQGKMLKSRYCVIYYLPNNTIKTYYGIAVSKSLGNAVIRNKLKRQYRNIIDNNKFLFQKQTNYIIMIRKESLNVSFEILNNNVKTLLEKGDK